MRLVALALLALLLAACSSSPTPGPPATTAALPGSIKIGKPYRIDGKWYYPRHDPNYDTVGVASWYGSDFHGLKTANGEIFDMNAISAAHTTLPLPSLVRVTNLENGRQVVLRVNDRGPFVDDRVIDLSQAAARELGFERNGLAKVRVQFVGFADGTTLIAAPHRLPAARPERASPPVTMVADASGEPVLPRRGCGRRRARWRICIRCMSSRPSQATRPWRGCVSGRCPCAARRASSCARSVRAAIPPRSRPAPP
jgi:rare lipoprotein A (peptidoglycan hydrolase)